MHKGPEALIAIIQESAPHPRSWASLVGKDLQWLGAWTHHEVPQIPQGVDEIRNFVLGFSKNSWSSLVDRALRGSIAARTAEPPGRIEDTHDTEPMYFCYECGDSFHTSQQLMTHFFSEHGRKNSVRCWAAGVSCRSCLKLFHSRPRLIKHLAYNSSRCLETLKTNVPPMSSAEVAELDAQDLQASIPLRKSGRRETSASMAPAVRLSGPLRFS